jgi:hypothetical protein
MDIATFFAKLSDLLIHAPFEIFDREMILPLDMGAIFVCKDKARLLASTIYGISPGMVNEDQLRQAKTLMAGHHLASGERQD